MGQGMYIFCEMDSIQEAYPEFENAVRSLESKALAKCSLDWGPSKKFSLSEPFGGDSLYGRTSILPALFDDHNGNQMYYSAAAVAPWNDPRQGTWRQEFTVAGHQTLLAGCRAGNGIPEDFKVAWMGLAFPNKNQHITEVKWQLSNSKYGRINLEQIHSFNKPAIVFEEGVIIDEEESFELYGYVEGPIPQNVVNYLGNPAIIQSIIPLGCCYYRVIDKVLGACGSVI